MTNQLIVKVTLVGSKVDSENDNYLDYHFPVNERKKAYQIVKSSLYSYPVSHIETIRDKWHTYVVVTLNGPRSAFINANMQNTNDIYKDTFEALAYNYGDGGPDGWMEGDIYIDPTHELFLDLVSVEYYKNGKPYMLFEK